MVFQWLKFLREERKFADTAALRTQIARDREKALRISRA